MLGAEWGATERKSRGNVEVENITNKQKIWTEVGEYGGKKVRWKESDEVRSLIEARE